MEQESQTITPERGMRWGWTLVIIIIIVVGWGVVRQSPSATHEAEARIADDGSLILDSVTAPAGGGFVAVYETQGDTRTLVGQSAFLSAGTYENVSVIPAAGETFRRRNGSGTNTRYEAVAYADDGDGVFEPESDEPMVDEETGEIELTPIEVVESDEGEGTMIPDTDEADATGESATATSSDTVVVGDDTTEPETNDPTEADEAPVVVVRYTDQGFTPTMITIAVGQTVRFVNESLGNMWVASAIHPTHEELEGFDQLEAVSTGASYEYIFTEAGNWRYHNHVHAVDTGVIVVE